jgi:hypothetical protein
MYTTKVQLAFNFGKPAPMTEFRLTGAALWERMNRAVEKVQERLEKTARTLEAAEIPYCIIGGNAVRAWVAQKDEAAVRKQRVNSISCCDEVTCRQQSFE